jgi:hypothetical protein
VGRYPIILVKFNNFIRYGRGRDGNGLLLHELLEIVEEDDKDGTIIYNDPVEDFTGNYRSL